jgi:DNA ligase (NAD+)
MATTRTSGGKHAIIVSPRGRFLNEIVEVAAQRAAQLRQELEYHNHRYYVLDDPVIPDSQYDLLFRELVNIKRTQP